MDIEDKQKNLDFLKKYKDINRKMEEDAAAAQAVSLGLPYMNLHYFPVDLNALSMTSKEQAIDSESIIFYKDGYDLRFGTINPKNEALQKLAQDFKEKKYQPKIYLISKSSYNQMLEMFAKVTFIKEATPDFIKVEDMGSYIDRLKDLAQHSSAVRTASEIIEILLGAAYEYNASDIHIEPEADLVKIRYRMDGVLNDLAHLPKFYQKTLISRIKVFSKLKLNVDNIPQDGRFSFDFKGTPIDVRVSILPGNYGESCVMRLLGNSEVNLNFDDLGFVGKSRQRIERELAKPNGMILTTGPTGSGKTTTLYTFIGMLNEPGVKIITLEDPVEYRLEGIVQTPITSGISFASGLRAILRQDPDVIMVGEIRDIETAETAMQAALTGHIVLSTLHTNDAAGAIPRLLNMGVKPFVVAPALNAIIAQRLVRKLCKPCKQETQLDTATLERVKKIIAAIPKNAEADLTAELKFYRAPGCKACNNLGYKGRIGVFEVIVRDDGLEKLIMAGAPGIDIKKYAVEQGMLTMVQDGILKALQGITDVEEVFRVTSE